MTKPLQVKLHKAKQAMSNADSAIMRSTGKTQNQLAAEHRRAIEERQAEIDHHNLVLSREIDPAFENLQLQGRDIVVRLHMENYIKNISFYADDTPLYDAWISQVDGRMHKSGKPEWMDNPLPYVYSGTVVAMSPRLTYEMEEDAKTMLEKGIKNFKKLTVGDTVTLNHFMYPDRMFYLNKQYTDFIKNPKEYRVEHWEGYVKISSSLIETIVTDQEVFYNEISPYNQYKKALEQKALGKELLIKETDVA